MQHKISLALYKNLLDSQFFILDNQHSSKKKIINIQQITEDFASGASVHALNISLLVSTLKQFIKTLRFLRVSPNSELHFLVDDLFQHEFIKKFFVSHPLLIPVKINSIDSKNSGSVNLLIDLRRTPTETHSTQDKFASQPFLIFKINSSTSERSCTNYYKMYNELNESNKLIFFLILIRSILVK